MKHLNKPLLMQHYIQKYQLQKICSLDLMKICTLVQYDKDDLLFHAGQSYGDFFILIEGECYAYVVTGGDNIHCEQHYHGVDFMGMVSLLWDKPVINHIKALTPCIGLSISSREYRDSLSRDIQFLRFTSFMLAKHISSNAVNFDPLEVRFALFIRKMSRGQIFHYNLTQCADLLSISYRHLLRTLTSFCEQGILEKRKRGHYIILDEEALDSLCSTSTVQDSAFFQFLKEIE